MGRNSPPAAEAATGPFTRARLETLVLLLVSLALAALIYLLLHPLVPALSWALALAVVAAPIHRRIARRLKKRKGLASGLAVVIVALGIVLPFVFVTQQVVTQARQGIAYARSPEAKQKWEQYRQKHPKVGQAADWARQRFFPGAQGGQQGGSGGSDVAQTVLGGTIGAVVQLFIALFTLFFFFRDREQIVGFFRRIVPLTNDEASRVFKMVNDTVHATIFGHMGVALIQGALGGLMFWILGLPGPLLWGVAMALLSIIPTLGAFIVWVPAAIFLVLSGSVGKAVALTAWGVLVVGTIDNVLYPRFVGDRLRLHTLAVFLSIIGGLQMFGAVGIVLGPLVLALAVATLEIWRRRTSGGQSAEERLEAA